jgi:hypothetical protein
MAKSKRPVPRGKAVRQGNWNRWLPWWLAAVVAAVLTALAGWLIFAAAALVAWLPTGGDRLEIPLTLASRFWLLAHGGGAQLGGGAITIVPLGFTLLIMLIGSGLAATATFHSFTSAPAEEARLGWLLRIGGVFTLTYAVIVAVTSNLLQPGFLFGRALGIGFVIAALMGLRGVGRALGWKLSLELVRLRWPRWCDAIPQALGAGLGIIIASGALVVFISFITHKQRIIDFATALDTGDAGGFLLALLQLGWLPNLVLWAVSWVCGAGFSLGGETLVSPVTTQVGLLPSVPIFGAVPSTGLQPSEMLWWLGAAVLAGAVAAGIMLRSYRDDQLRRRDLVAPRPDLTAALGAASGIVTGLLTVGIVSLSGGDLAQGQMAGFGPLKLTLLILAPTLMGLAGLVVGAVGGAFSYQWKFGSDKPQEPVGSDSQIIEESSSVDQAAADNDAVDKVDQ